MPLHTAIKKILIYLALILFVWNFPSFIMQNVSASLSGLLSVMSFGILILYFVLYSDYNTINLWGLFLGLLYFTFGSLSGQTYLPLEDTEFVYETVKYFIIILFGYELLKSVDKQTLFWFLLLGSLSIILQILFFYNPLKDTGRYSGFYLNPNLMGFVCMMGYGLCYSIDNKKLRTLGQVIFSIMGILTFSRTFLAVWILMNGISIFINIKYVKTFIYGVVMLVALLTYNAFLPVQNVRIAELNAVLSGNVAQSNISEGSRTETWSKFYSYIQNKPFFGNGYGSFGGSGVHDLGVHNIYLKILGETGIIPLVFFVVMIFLMLYYGIRNFRNEPGIFMMAVGLSIYIGTNHTLFYNGVLLFLLMWIQQRTLDGIKIEKTET